jgi:hypothetical protein
MESTIVRAAWRQTRFEYENRNMTMYLSVNEGQIPESRDFRGIWMFYYHESQLSARQQKQSGDGLTNTSFGRKNEECSSPRE